MVHALSARGEEWLDGMGDDLCPAVLDAEPAPALTIDEDRAEVAFGSRRGIR